MEPIEYCIDVITAEHLHAVDCRRRVFTIFAIARAEDHRLLHRIAAAAAFLVRMYHFLSNRLCTVSLPAEVELPPSQDPKYHRVLHRITAAAADDVHLLLYSSFYQTSSLRHRKRRGPSSTELGSSWANIEPLPWQESEAIEHRTKEGY